MTVLVKAVKAVRFSYRPTSQTRELLETFRMMVNHAIDISMRENIRGRRNIRDRIYHEFQERYGVVSYYPYCVAEVAWSILKKHRRWHRRPVAERLVMKMDSQNYRLDYAILGLPFRKGEQRLLIPLEYGDYQRSFLMDATLKRGSVTMTDSAIIVAFSKETMPAEPMRGVGYDLNEKSIVGSDESRYDLSEVARLHTEYGVRRRDFYKRHPHDERLKRRFSRAREKNRVKQFLNRVSKAIVEKARAGKQAIVLEKLKGIRYVYQRGNGRSKASRRRIAQWPFRELQHQIEYKAGWHGVRVEYVSTAWNSKTCSRCGYINRALKLTDREWLCPSCGVTHDRDLNAAVNIERRGQIPCLPMVLAEARGGVKL